MAAKNFMIRSLRKKSTLRLDLFPPSSSQSVRNEQVLNMLMLHDPRWLARCHRGMP